MRFFRSDLRHRMKHLGEKKQMMIGAVLEKVQGTLEGECLLLYLYFVFSETL
jgi:hypothetical protein